MAAHTAAASSSYSLSSAAAVVPVADPVILNTSPPSSSSALRRETSATQSPSAIKVRVPTEHPKHWTPAQVAAFLTSQGLPEGVGRAAMEQRVDGKLLLAMELAELEELGIASHLLRRKVKVELEELNEPEELENLGSVGHKHLSNRGPALRAAVLGMDDGLISVASVIMGVAGSGATGTSLVLTGIAAIAAGAMSMAAGEYVSVSTQRDAEKADMAKERAEHEKGDEARARERLELIRHYVEKGMSRRLAFEVVEELTQRGDIVAVHLREELGMDTEELARPFQAALISAVCFTCGGILPVLITALVHDALRRVIVIVVATGVALVSLGSFAAQLGGAPLGPAAIRVGCGGLAAMGITFAVGKLFGSTEGHAG